MTADEFVLALGKAGADDMTYHRLAYVDHCPHSLVAFPEMRKVVDDFFVRMLMHPETAKKPGCHLVSGRFLAERLPDARNLGYDACKEDSP